MKPAPPVTRKRTLVHPGSAGIHGVSERHVTGSVHGGAGAGGARLTGQGSRLTPCPAGGHNSSVVHVVNEPVRSGHAPGLTGTKCRQCPVPTKNTSVKFLRPSMVTACCR